MKQITKVPSVRPQLGPESKPAGGQANQRHTIQWTGHPVDRPSIRPSIHPSIQPASQPASQQPAASQWAAHPAGRPFRGRTEAGKARQPKQTVGRCLQMCNYSLLHIAIAIAAITVSSRSPMDSGMSVCPPLAGFRPQATEIPKYDT